MTSLEPVRVEGATHTGPKITLVNSTDKTIKARDVGQHEQIIPLTEKRKMFAENHNGTNLDTTPLVVKDGLVAFNCLKALKSLAQRKGYGRADLSRKIINGHM